MSAQMWILIAYMAEEETIIGIYATRAECMAAQLVANVLTLATPAEDC